MNDELKAQFNTACAEHGADGNAILSAVESALPAGYSASAAALPIGTILNLVLTFLPLLIKDANQLAAIKQVIALLQQIFPQLAS